MRDRDEVSAAIDKSKASLKVQSGDPHIPVTQVWFREIVHSLEILWGYTEHELAEGCDPKAPQALADALCTGDLVARVYSPNLELKVSPIIPSVSWRPINPARGENAHDSGFWMYPKLYNTDCDGFGGEMAVLIRDEAEKWLAKMSEGFKNYVLRDRIRQLFQDGHNSIHPNDPYADRPKDTVSLPVLAYALEQLQGGRLERMAGRPPSVYEHFLDALVDGRLVAVVRETQAEIPTSEWLVYRSKDAHAFASGFIEGTGFENHRDQSLRGTPVVRAEAAMEWLITPEIAVTSADMPFNTEGELKAWYRDERFPELEAMDEESRPAAAERGREIVARDSIVSGDKRERARRIRAEVEPLDWQSRGRRRTSIK